MGHKGACYFGAHRKMIRKRQTVSTTPSHHLSVSLRPCSGHQFGASPASPSGRHPDGPARGPSPATAATAGVLAVPARSAVVLPGPGRRGGGFGPRAAAAAGAADPEAEAADPAADPHRRVPAAARAAVPAARGPAAGTH